MLLNNPSGDYSTILTEPETNTCFSLIVKGAVTRNSAKLGKYKMPVKLRETLK